jgi:hypothetical protein
MLKPVTKKMIDNSADGVYQFAFHCDICDAPNESATYQSNTRQVTTDTRESEYIAAYERANREAIKNFNRCPLCGKLVCDACFLLMAESDMCKECAALRGEGDEAL